MQIRAFEPSDEAVVIALWEKCGLLRPWNDPHQDIARKQLVQPELFLVGLEADQIIATVMGGFDGHRGWINYLSVDPHHQRNGYARLIMAAVEQGLLERGCPKINLQIRCDNLEAIQFYERLSFTQDSVLSFGKRLLLDD